MKIQEFLKYIVLKDGKGNNIPLTDAQIQFAKMIDEAKQNGSKLIISRGLHPRFIILKK